MNPNHAHRSLWHRLLDAVTDARRRQAESLWTDIVARNGGNLTDESERKISLYL